MAVRDNWNGFRRSARPQNQQQRDGEVLRLILTRTTSRAVHLGSDQIAEV